MLLMDRQALKTCDGRVTKLARGCLAAGRWVKSPQFTTRLELKNSDSALTEKQFLDRTVKYESWI